MLELLGDKGYDAEWFRQALAERGITACIPSKSNSKKLIEHDRTLFTANATKSRICLAGSRTGGVFIPATTDALTSSCLPTVSPPSSSSGYNQ
jgi:hypothetical protein